MNVINNNEELIMEEPIRIEISQIPRKLVGREPHKYNFLNLLKFNAI